MLLFLWYFNWIEQLPLNRRHVDWSIQRKSKQKANPFCSYSFSYFKNIVQASLQLFSYPNSFFPWSQERDIAAMMMKELCKINQKKGHIQCDGLSEEYWNVERIRNKITKTTFIGNAFQSKHYSSNHLIMIILDHCCVHYCCHLILQVERDWFLVVEDLGNWSYNKLFL
jgi:hypothetical protein